MTPEVKGADHYEFTEPTPPKYRLSVQADVVLDPDVVNETNCVGQNINFSLNWSPGRPPIVSSNNVQWTLDGTYVNTNLPPIYSDGSSTYVLDANLLKSETTHGWWYDGQYNPVTLTAAFKEDVTFDNGQTASLNASGLFAMHRPKVDYSNFGQIAEYLEHTHSPGGQPSVDMDKLVVGNCQYSADVDTISPFSGKTHITQTFSGSFGSSGDGGYDTHGANTLDNAVTYPRSVPNEITVLPDVSANIIQFQDAPSVPCNGQTWDHSIYTDYITFRPDSGGSIDVTLGVVTWHNDGDSDLSPTPQDYTPFPTSNELNPLDGYYYAPTGDAKFDSQTTANTFPSWQHTYHNGDKNF